MEAQELREKLTEYIKVADERKLNAIYTLVEDEVETEYKWWEDEALVAEMEEDVRKIEAGEEPSFTEEEVYSEIHKRLDQSKTAHV